MKTTGDTDGIAPAQAGADPEREWERPVAVAKDRNVRAWLIFLGLLCFGVALWTPLRALYYRHGYPRSEVEVKRDADTFVAVAYYGIDSDAAEGSQDISRAAFAEQLRLLREKGYTPIGLRDVFAFYKEGKPLPRKAILMTFEQSRKSTYFEIRDLLHLYKWKAVMGVVTAPMHQKDAQALLWPYLRDMLTMGSWDLAAQSERGFDFIPTSPAGRTGAFFANPRWLEDQRRYELPEEFNRRVEEDHRKVIGEFEKETGAKPVAFFFPYGDYGQYEEQAKVVRVTNMHQVGAHYGLGFILGRLALNTRNSDPRRLNRLLVNPAWTPEEFIRKLETFWPVPPGRGRNRGACGTERWIGEWGDVSVRDGEVVLRAIPPENPVMTLRQSPVSATTGAKAWLAGSDTFEDGYFSVRLQLKRGRFGVYLRSTSMGEYVYVSLDNAGKVSVRQRLQDMDELMLATDALSAETRQSHELLVCLRDNLLFARLDGETLFGGRVLLRGEPKPGLAGVGIWDPLPGMAEASILDARLVARRDALVTWTPDVAKDVGYLTQWLNEHGYQFNVLSPPWLDVYESAPITFPAWDRKALNLLARTNNMKILPQVQIRDATLLLKIPAAELIERVLEHEVQGLYVDTSSCTPEQVTPLVTWLVRLQEAMAAKNLLLALKLPVSIESLPSAGNILKLLPGVLLAGDFQDPPFGLTDRQVLGITRVTPSASDETLSLYYQLSGLFSVYNDVSPDAKSEELRQRGFDAFTAGEYQDAIRIWNEWLKSEPRNAEALALIGDAWLRLNMPDKALEAYTQSLEINPGQMNLAIRHARLLEQLDRLDESADVLNVYARAFPDSPAVTIAQAQWLDRHRQRNEARRVMKGLVERHPDNIEARLILQTMLDEPQERYANMHELLEIGRGADTHLFGFGRDIFAAELLTIPEASVFFDFVRNAAAEAPNKKTRELYQGFLPLTEKVSENFVMNKLSDNWIAFGGFRPSAYGRYELRAGSDMSEAFLRLKKSELVRDGFIEVMLDESAGAFWLYARRCTKSMVRYGYDDEGFIRIQTWLNGELRTYESRPWLRPPGTVRLRLEVRGDGAVGYVNGKPAFTTPLVIPQEVCYGWWSIAPFSPELGLARARIARIDCGPLTPTVLLVPRMSGAEMRAALDAVRLHVRDLSAVAPVAFTQLADGTIPAEPEIELGMLKMFCTFHRLRLMPVVDLAYYSAALPEHLTNLILKNRLSGLILRVRTPPEPAWYAKMEKMLESTTADFIVVRQEDWYWPRLEKDAAPDPVEEIARLKKLPKVNLREIQRGNLLLHPVKTEWDVPALPYPEWAGTLAVDSREGIEPRIVVLPRSFRAFPDGAGEGGEAYTRIARPAEPKPVLQNLPAEAAPAGRAPTADPGAAETANAPAPTVPIPAAVTNAPVPVIPAPVADALNRAGAVTGAVRTASGTVTGAVEAVRQEAREVREARPQPSLWQRLRTRLGAGEAGGQAAPPPPGAADAVQ
jgi:tetratricopeptide (TPR) repeat protein/peptidoglycan/xylan/chitin deacetylase (PgdA/CDA1 family)